MGLQNGRLRLFYCRPGWWCSGLRSPKRWHVYCVQISRWNEFMGIYRRQYVVLDWIDLPKTNSDHPIAPVYTSEIAPPALRGVSVGMNGVGIAIGYSLATYMGLAFYHSTNMSTQWRGPYGISLIFTALPSMIVPFVPESPRWLLMRNRVDDAKQVVRGLHNLSNNNEHHFAIVEFYQMQKQLEYDRTLKPSYWQLFKRASYRKRLIMSAGYAFLGQSTAILGNCG